MLEIWAERHRLPAEVEHAAWGEMMVDGGLWRPVVKTIGRRAGLEMGGEVVAGYPGSSAVFVIGRQAVIKLFPPFFARDFAVERTVYELLHGRIALMPALLASGIYHDRSDWPFLVLSYMPGEPIRELLAQLPAGERAALARQAGGVLREVHATSLGEEAVFAGWPDFLAERHDACLRELQEKTALPAALRGEIGAFLAEMVPELRRAPGVLVNGDLTDDHALLVQGAEGWRLGAIIDWGDAEVAHPSYEWIAAWFGFCRRDPVMFRALVSACRPEQRFDESLRRELLALTFLHRFGALIVAESWGVGRPEALTLSGLEAWLWSWKSGE